MKIKFTIYLLIVSILFSCTSKKSITELENNYTKTKEELNQIILKLNSKIIENETLKSELNSLSQNSSVKQTLQLSEDIKNNKITLNDLPNDFIEENEDEFDLNILKNRKFSNNPVIEGYRNNIKELIGSVIELNQQNEIIDVGEFNFISDNKKVKIEAPKGGKFIEKTYSKTTNKEAGWLFFSYSVKEKELIRFSIEDVSSAYLLKGALDYKNLHKAYNVSDFNIDNLYVIRTINVSEIISRKYQQESKNLKISEVPIGGTIFKASNDYYVSNSDLKRDYIVGLGYSKLKNILTQSAHLIDE